MNDVRVVRADLSDTRQTADFIALMQTYATDAMGGGQALSDTVVERLVPELRQRNNVCVLLAYDGDECVGMTTLVDGFSTFAAAPLLNIHDMVVKRSARGRGISHALLHAAEAEARRKGCCKLTLEVLSNNAIAQASYRKFGFSDYVLDPDAGNAWFWQKRL